MERKSFERGTVVGGVVRIIISIIAMAVAVIVLVNTIQTWDPEEIGGKVFMCVIGAFILAASVAFVINGVQMLRNGKKSMEVSRKGHSERGRISENFRYRSNGKQQRCDHALQCL